MSSVKRVFVGVVVNVLTAIRMANGVILILYILISPQPSLALEMLV